MTPYVCPGGEICDPGDAGACAGAPKDCVALSPENSVPGQNLQIQAKPGDTIAYDVWVEDTSPTAVKTWQVWMFCGYTATAGELSFVSNVVTDLRCDYIFPFFGLCPPPTVAHLPPTANQGQCPTDVTNFEPRTSNVATPNPGPPFNEDFPVVTDARYLSTWTWHVSADAQGVFVLAPKMINKGTGTVLTKILDPSDAQIDMTVDVLEVVLPVEKVGQCCNVTTCLGDFTESECFDMQGGTDWDPNSSCGQDPCDCTSDADCTAGGVFDDGNVCTADVCAPQDPAAEPDTGCVRDAAGADGNPCDDGDICTLADACANGACAGDALDCSALDSDDGCITGVCNATTGTCEPQFNDGAACDDGVPCTAFDTCNAGVCAGEPMVTAVFDIELQPTVVPQPFQRCIRFDFAQCDGPVTTVEQVVTFGVNPDAPGLVLGVEVPVPDVGGCFDCVTAVDPLHALPVAANDFAPDQTTGTYVGDFTGDHNQGGAWLLGGSLDGLDTDGIARIDILDFGTWLTNAGQQPVDTDCATEGPHADVNGDGLANIFDFTFIQVNFLTTAEPGCCGGPAPDTDGSDAQPAGRDADTTPPGRAGRRGPLERISIRELTRMGLAHLRVADLNNDGWVDTKDMALAAAGER